ncbi:MAG: folate family ECF transporter S component [Bacillota bacterium]
MNKKLETIILIILLIGLGISAKYIYTFSFSIGNMSEISINLVALPSIIASILLGPLWGALIGGATDITGHLLHPIGSFLPQITLITIVRGFLPGYLIKHLKFKNKILVKLFYVIGITLIITQVLLMSVVLSREFNYNLIDTIFIRLLIQVFTIPVFVGVSYIIIKYLKVRKKLVQREEQYQTLVSNIPDTIFRCQPDKNWTMIFISDCIEKITGFTASTFINNKDHSYNSIIHEEDRVKVEKIIKEHIAQKKSYLINYRVIDSRGKIKYILEKGQGIFSAKGELLYIDGVISDITEVTKKEERLKKANKNLIVTRERNRIARELHDSISQSLHGINYSIHSLKQMILDEVDYTDFTDILNHLEGTIEESLQELKNMISELKPTKLEGKGLCQALVTQCELFADRINIKLTHDIDDVKNMTPEQELAVYRILQESLTNIQKHSEADQVRIFLKEIKGKVFLTIADNGKGLNINFNQGHGLKNMKTRAFQNNGKLEAESLPGNGTVIRVAFDILEND